MRYLNKFIFFAFFLIFNITSLKSIQNIDFKNIDSTNFSINGFYLSSLLDNQKIFNSKNHEIDAVLFNLKSFLVKNDCLDNYDLIIFIDTTGKIQDIDIKGNNNKALLLKKELLDITIKLKFKIGYFRNEKVKYFIYVPLKTILY